MKLLLLFAAAAIAAYTLAYWRSDEARRESLKWAAFHVSWISTIATLAAAWRN